MAHFNKQHELIQSLRKQLEATERELANQKWVFEQFLQSPSWRLTYPIRWLAKQLRALRDWILRRPTIGAANDRSGGHRPPLQQVPEPDEVLDTPEDLKELLTSTQRLALQSLLASDTKIRIPSSPNPDISILIVLFNRAELTLACLRSIVENSALRLEVIIIDNASSDLTPLLLERLDGARIIRNTENLHFLAAVNQGARQARGE